MKDYVGVIAGPVFNNIQLNYFPANDNEGNSKPYWYAATANNALHDTMALRSRMEYQPRRDKQLFY
ncbi:MAG: hypothetical protein SH848_10440 [Saprospiraceae bacterium]|nr:hypothetical protein [Saprospiraceae bacterium]